MKTDTRGMLEEFEQKGLGPLYTEFESERIDAEEFLRRLDKIENRPVKRIGRFLDAFLGVAFPIAFFRK